MAPPGSSSRSRTVTLHPALASRIAAMRPLWPAPTTIASERLTGRRLSRRCQTSLDSRAPTRSARPAPCHRTRPRTGAKLATPHWPRCRAHGGPPTCRRPLGVAAHSLVGVVLQEDECPNLGLQLFHSPGNRDIHPDLPLVAPDSDPLGVSEGCGALLKRHARSHSDRPHSATVRPG